MDKQVLDDIVTFIDNNFINGDEKQNIINLSILIKYINTIDTDNFDFDCFSYILRESSKIKELLDFIIKSEDKDFYMRHFFISNIIYIYGAENNIDVDYDDNQENIGTKKSINYNDIDDDPIDVRTNSLDLIKLYKRDIKGAIPFNREEEIEIFKRYNDATGYLKEEIRNEIVFHNLRHVFNMAVKKSIGKNIPLGDLIQEGSIGLMKAVEKFDVSKGYKFSTYSRSWINQAMNIAIANQLRNITRTANEQLVKIYRIISEYENMYGETPDEYYIASELNIKVSRVQELLIMSNVISLNEKTLKDGDKEASEIQDFILSEEEDNGIFGSLAARIDFKDAVLSSPYLNDREKQVINLRFGLDKGRVETLEDIGRKLNVTRQRIALIENKSIKKLRKDPRVKTYDPSLEQ